MVSISHMTQTSAQDQTFYVLIKHNEAEQSNMVGSDSCFHEIYILTNTPVKEAPTGTSPCEYQSTVYVRVKMYMFTKR